jgi:hypothetical protein
MRVTSFLYLLPLLSFASALQPISRVGRYLYGADGKRFLIKVSTWCYIYRIFTDNDTTTFQGRFIPRARDYCCSERPECLPRTHELCRSVRFLLRNVQYHIKLTFFARPRLADGAACKRDLPFLTGLGVNAIRVYSVNSSLNHDVCMNLFSQANIYTMSVL